MNGLLWTSSLWFSQLVYWTACAQAGRCRGRDTPRVCALPQPCSSSEGLDQGREYLCTLDRQVWVCRAAEHRSTSPYIPVFAVISPRCAVTDSVAINNQAVTLTELRNSASHLCVFLRTWVLRARKTNCSTYVFIVPNTKLNCRKKKKRKKERFIQDIQRKWKRVCISVPLQIETKTSWYLSATTISNFISIHTVHTQHLHCYLPTGLFLCSVKMVFTWKQLLCHHLLLWISAGDLRETNLSGVYRHAGLLSNMLG